MKKLITIIIIVMLGLCIYQQVQIYKINKEINRIVECGLCTEKDVENLQTWTYYLVSDGIGKGVFEYK